MSSVDSSLAREVDAYRDLLEAGSAKRASAALQLLLSKLPGEATPYIIFRIKANIGHCQLQLGDKEGALQWFDDAVKAAPTEPRAVALQAYAMFVQGDFQAASAYSRTQLILNPENEHLAAHLIEATAFLDDGTDPEALIPVALLERERVLIARCILHKHRDNRSAWWALSRLGAQRFPGNWTLQQLAAESEVEELVRTCRGQTYRSLNAREKSRVTVAADRLEQRWRQLKGSEVPDRDDGIAALTTAMVARTLLEERDAAMSLASELIAETDDEASLTMAAQMAANLDNEAVANAAMSKLPDTGSAAFLKGMAACNHSDWATASNHFSKATVPEPERELVRMIVQLGGIDSMDNAAAQEALSGALQEFAADPRALIVLAGMAERKGLPEVATGAYRAAVALIGPALHYPARVMIASHAYRSDDFDVIIRVLGSYVDAGVWSKELQWLADAHASEYPPRPRNIKFFAGLPKHTREIATIARGHASKLLDLKRPNEAEPILRRITEENPTDVFSQLKFVEALRQLGKDGEANAVVASADEIAMLGPSTYRLSWAHQLREAGEPTRAISYAFHLLRLHPLEPKIALGYVGLVFGDRSERIIPPVDEVTTDCWVAIESSAGDRDAFCVDEGQAILGIELVPSNDARAQRVLGLRLGQTFEVKAIDGRVVTWTVKEIKSKYLAVLHAVMESFEKRFPTAQGLWRLSVEGENVQPVLNVIREQSKAKRETTERLYVEGHLPLAFAAQALGTNALAFARYLRTMGLEVATVGGSVSDNKVGIKISHEYRSAGATLDTYTAITAAEMDCLGALKSWFGSLAVAISSIETIDHLLEQAKSALGKEGMSIGWKDGEFYREIFNDEDLNRQIGHLETIKSRIVASCEIVVAELPDDLPAEVAQFNRTTGREAMDAMYIAAARGDVLLSDDLFYRQIAATLTKVDGAWLQVVLLLAHLDGQITDEHYATACVNLAYRRHGNLWLDAAALLLIAHTCSEDEFGEVCHFVGSPNAQMWSHTVLVVTFVQRLWRSRLGMLKKQVLTSTIVTALLRYRGNDWHIYLGLIWVLLEGSDLIRSYLLTWMRGHFLPIEPVEAARREWTIAIKSKVAPSSAGSPSAMLAGSLSSAPIKLKIKDPDRTSQGSVRAFTAENRDPISKSHVGKRSRRRKRPRSS